MAKRGDQRAHVMRSAEEGRTDDAPQNRGQPAKLHGCGDGPRNGASAGNRSKVVPQQDGRMGRTVVDPIFELDSRSLVRVGKAVHIRHKAPINDVADDKYDSRNTKHHWKQHIKHTSI